MKNNESSSYFDMRCGAVPDFITPEQYVDEKLEMLTVDMCIVLDDEEVRHLRTLKTEGDINRAVQSIIERHWSKYM